MECTQSLQFWFIISSDVFRPFRRPVYRFEHPNSGAQKTLSKFFFQLYFNKKYVEVAINYFKVHQITSKWLRIQKCRQKRKTMRQRDRSERRNCQRKCFHSLNYVIDHASIRFFFYIISLQFTLLCVIPSVLHAASFKLRPHNSSQSLIAV